MAPSSAESLLALENVVGGESVGALTGETREIVNPATGQPIGVVPEGGAADVDRAVEAATAAFAGWRLSTPAQRSTALMELAELLMANTEELARLESANVGKPLAAALEENEVSADNLRFFAAAARTLEGRAAGEYTEGYTSMLRREPVGVVGQIAPWNYPLQMGVWKIGPALAAGNAIVLKPSELTPLTMLRFAELAREAGILPPGVLNVISGDGEPVGAGIVEHPGVRMVSLTGDVATGKKVAAAAAQTLKRVHLELGGKAPMVVFDDADLDAVAAAIRVGGFYNSGQDCTAASRVLVSADAYDSLIERVVPELEAIAVGDPLDEATQMGPLISAARREEVASFVPADAPVAIRGSAPGGPGFWFPPTVLAPVGNDDRAAREEIFGPVACVVPFDDEADAVRLANETIYGLSGSIWTRDGARALRVARAIDSGVLSINSNTSVRVSTPFGGFKQSGVGRELGPDALEHYTELKNVYYATEEG